MCACQSVRTRGGGVREFRDSPSFRHKGRRRPTVTRSHCCSMSPSRQCVDGTRGIGNPNHEHQLRFVRPTSHQGCGTAWQSPRTTSCCLRVQCALQSITSSANSHSTVVASVGTGWQAMRRPSRLFGCASHAETIPARRNSARSELNSLRGTVLGHKRCGCPPKHWQSP